MSAPSRSATTTRAPRSRKSAAVAARIPAAPPVTRTALFVSSTRVTYPEPGRCTRRPTPGGLVDDGDRVDLDQKSRLGQRVHRQEGVGGLVVAEHRDPRRRDVGE